MAIQKIEGNFGKFISDPGEYLVEVNSAKAGKSKKGKPMLTVEFETEDGRTIGGYYVRDLAFHMKSLEQLKLACGLKLTDTADNLVGRKCGILVEPQEPNTETGKIFMQIVGYGTVAELGTGTAKPASDFAPAKPIEEVPF